MYKYLKHEEVDYAKWDKCVYTSRHGHIFALSWYLDVVAPGWEAIVEEGEEEYVLIFPIPVHRKIGIKYAYQPIYAHYLGIISINELQENEYKKVGELLQRHIKLISGYHFNLFNDPNLINCYWQQQNILQTTHLIDLQASYTDIYNRFKNDQKRKLKRAKDKFTIEENHNIDILLDLFRKFTHRRIFMKSEESYALLRELYNQLVANKMCKLYYAVDKASHQAEAGALFLIFKKHIMIFISSVSDQGKVNGAAVQLINHILETYSEQDGFIFDFKAGGKVTSLHRFFKSFGSKEATFAKISYNHLPFPIPQVRNLRIAFYKWLYPREEN